MDELSELDLKDLGEYLIDKEETLTNSALLFAKTINSTELSASTSTNSPPIFERAEELANADKELDRLLSLARQKDVKTADPVPLKPFCFDMLKPLQIPCIPLTSSVNTVQVSF